MTKKEAELKFKKILESRDKDLVYEFFEINFDAFSLEEIGKMKIELLNEDWHSIHEELVSSIQRSKNPIAAEILFKIAFREELDMFEYKPLARKCTWALADIGTNEAKEYLMRMAKSNDLIIKEYAQKRLLNWEKEIHRKG